MIGARVFWCLICEWVSLGISLLSSAQSKEEVMAVRLREADNIAAMAELQQHISELEIQVTFQTPKPPKHRATAPQVKRELLQYQDFQQHKRIAKY